MRGTCTDTIFLERLSVKGKHGVHDTEREKEQEFLIDISAVCDTRAAAASDALADAIDYSRFRKIAQEVVSGNSFFLIERLAESIATRVLEDTRIDSVTVTIRKPAVYPDTTPGASITRVRV